MKKLLKSIVVAALFLLPIKAHALIGPFVQITTGTLQLGTTAGFFVSSGTAKNLNVPLTLDTFTGSTTTLRGSITLGVSGGTTTVNGTVNYTGEPKFNGIAASSGMIPIAQGSGLAPKWAFTGKVLQVVTISTANAQKTSTSASYATTGLSGSFTAKQVGSSVLVFVQQVFGASGTAGTVCTARVRRDSTDLIIGNVNDYTVAINDSTTEYESGTFLFGIDTGQAGAVTLSTLFARTAGSGTCIANSTLSNTGTGAQMLVIEIGN